ncbi:MAG: sodium:alanine symporter family protein [Actinomycetaceae bacterium]|nr:sodium:alanine symporter family protein [Actinomycetaceae bacterium]
MQTLADVLEQVNDWLSVHLLIWLLIGAGIYFTIRSRFIQIRLFGQMIRQIFDSRDRDGDGISSFQAFAIGIASRVGVGNIAGVAIAVKMGGAGAVFWMWVIAFIGMATAFIEATLAQLFKIRWHDGTFRGGPAFYIQRGLGSRSVGAIFAIFLIFSFGISYEMVQANTIATTLHDRYDVTPAITAVVLLLICAPIVYGGIKRVAAITEWVAPIMAIVYILLALVVVLMNVDRIYPTLEMIVLNAFGRGEMIGGVAGSITAAMLNGARRGLFSNEAGEGSAPNAASTAQVTHPVKQGLIQSMGVFVDTILICSATAFIIFNASPGSLDSYWAAENPSGASMTITALESQLGAWVAPVMVVLISVFAGSSLIGNYAYAEVNVDFLTQGKKWGPFVLQTVTLVSIVVGALSELVVVWNFADITMTGMAVINITAILLLGKWAFGALRDYTTNMERPFVAVGNANMPGELPTDIWVEREKALA